MSVDASFFSPESDDGGDGDGDRRRRPMGSISWAVIVGIGGPPTGGGDGDRRRRPMGLISWAVVVGIGSPPTGGGDGDRRRRPMGLISSSLFRRDLATTDDDYPDLSAAAGEEGEVSEGGMNGRW